MNAHRIGRALSFTFFLVLFPGFVFYHYAVSVGVVPPFLGGLFGPVTMAVVVLYGLLFPMISNRLFATDKWYVMLFLSLVVFVTAVTLINFAAYGQANVSASAQQSVGAIVFWISLLFIGYFLPLESRKFFLMNLIFAFMIFGFLVHYVATTGDVFFYARQLYDAGEDVATYQGFARSALVIWMILTVWTRSELLRWTLVLTGLFSLFVLGARSELYTYLGLSVMLIMLLGVRSLKTLAMAAIASTVLVVGVVNNMESLGESRQLQIIDLRTSTSWNERENLEEAAWEVIKDNPLFGDFGSHALRGGTGFYAHNFLSAWENYGILGLVLYLSLTVLALVVAAQRCFLRPGPARDYWMMSLSVNFVCLVLVLLSKPVFWPIVALGWGLHLNAMVKSKQAVAAKARQRLAAWRLQPEFVAAYRYAAGRGTSANRKPALRQPRYPALPRPQRSLPPS